MRRWLIALLAFLMVLAIGIAFWSWWALVQPINGQADAASFTVKPGERSLDITQSLEKAGFIRSSLALAGYLRISGQSLLPGVYTLHANDSSLTNIQPILTGAIAERQVTIPEGLRLNEIAQLLEEKSVVKASDFLAAADYSPSLVQLPASYNLKAGTFLEGFTFPDTYRFSATATANEVIQRMLTDYVTRTQGLTMDYRTLILASMVEREAKFDEDRAPIAGVFVNRLNINMALQSNPTVQYAKATAACGSVALSACVQSVWWPAVSGADFSLDSPYNSYRVTGTPPRPISNPGLKSIQAAVNPDTASGYLYFIADKQGHAHFAKTLAEHNANIAQYLSQ